MHLAMTCAPASSERSRKRATTQGAIFSLANILWIFGRYDRPWPPERPVFGMVRYMSSESARRKLRLTEYLERYGPGERQLSLL